MGFLKRKKLLDGVTVAGTGDGSAQLTPFVDLRFDAAAVGVELHVHGTGGDVKCEFRVSPDGTVANASSFDDEADVTSSTATAYAGTPLQGHTYAVPAAATRGRYVQFQVEGVNANPATGVTVELWYTSREEPTAP